MFQNVSKCLKMSQNESKCLEIEIILKDFVNEFFSKIN